MKTLTLIITFFALTSTSTDSLQENVEFVCLKTHKASNTCYFNFKVDGAKYTYVDKGCRKVKNKEETITKVKEGDLALSRDWKIECPEPKQ
jgi:hypothetical protein